MENSSTFTGFLMATTPGPQFVIANLFIVTPFFPREKHSMGIRKTDEIIIGGDPVSQHSNIRSSDSRVSISQYQHGNDE